MTLVSDVFQVQQPRFEPILPFIIPGVFTHVTTELRALQMCLLQCCLYGVFEKGQTHVLEVECRGPEELATTSHRVFQFEIYFFCKNLMWFAVRTDWEGQCSGNIPGFYSEGTLFEYGSSFRTCCFVVIFLVQPRCIWDNTLKWGTAVSCELCILKSAMKCPVEPIQKVNSCKIMSEKGTELLELISQQNLVMP